MVWFGVVREEGKGGGSRGMKGQGGVVAMVEEEKEGRKVVVRSERE